MPISLSKPERSLLEKITLEARVLAESACRAALENLAVHEKDYRAHMNAEQRLLRNRLRARGRALGDKRDERSGVQGTYHLTELCAYEHWHRLLFTRFLTENHLLITDEVNGSVPITLEECEELAPELGARDGFDLACRFASLTLPGVFRRDDPVLDLPIALNDQVAMRKLLSSLPAEIFPADDALGWTYQFWQAQRKKQINDAGKEIGADELAPVTQLFTEDYMVEFLLHNTLGAWWAGRLGPIKAVSEDDARTRVALPALHGIPPILWTYLRFLQDETTKTWRPAAGFFDHWPRTANSIRLMDPCMGSGHFLVFALPVLVRLRMEEEHLTPQTAIAAVLKDNIHGLELDERCTQIAAFNVALTAWKLAGYQLLPSLNLACSGVGPAGTEPEWVMLAGDEDRLRRGMSRLHSLFKDAPLVGSLINPRTNAGNLIEAEFHELAPLLSGVLARDDKDTVELAVIAKGLAKAAELLSERFTLVITNVPYLGRGNQSEALKIFLKDRYKDAKADLAASFIVRCLHFCTQNGGTAAFVTPQTWLFLGSYKRLREQLLRENNWDFVAPLGTRAFETISGEVVNVALISLSRREAGNRAHFGAVQVSQMPTPESKASALTSEPVVLVSQRQQLSNPDHRVSLDHLGNERLLETYATCVQGLRPADRGLLVREFWEMDVLGKRWVALQSSCKTTQYYGGMEGIFDLKTFDLRWRELGSAYKGHKQWGRSGVCMSQMGSLPSSLYTGAVYDGNVNVFDVHDVKLLPAVWVFCTSPEFRTAVRKLDKKMVVTNATLAKVPFDVVYWQKVAEDRYPDGLPKPHSSSATSWLFNGQPKGSDQPLHVAVARLLGYRWPRQTGSSFPDCPTLGDDGLERLSDDDGIVCLPPVNREQPASARLRGILAAALGTFDERTLVAAAGLKGSGSKTIDDWLHDEFFEQHATLFGGRPFIWHLWDGLSDGFHALVNYHRLDYSNLQKLTYSYLGDWIQQQSEDAKGGKPGAALRLGAARTLQVKLAQILVGEAPLDIFARWKPLKNQAIGWNPDLNDGVRQNIRPFLLAGDVGKSGAGLFRSIPLSLKDKDQGGEPDQPKTNFPWFWCEDEPGTDPVGGKDFVGIRWNNVHLTLERKSKA